MKKFFIFSTLLGTFYTHHTEAMQSPRPLTAEQRLKRQADQLCCAAKAGDLARMTTLLDTGVNPNGHPKSDFPIVCALRPTNGPHFRPAELLLEYRVNVNAINHERAKDSLATLITMQNHQGIEWLLNHGAYELTGVCNKTPYIIKACQQLDIRLIEILCKNGADVMIRTLPDDSTPLHILVSRRNIKNASYALQAAIQLIQAGAEVNALDSQGRAPLHLLANTNHYELMNYFLHVGARTDIKDKGDKVPLAYAKYDRIKRLLSAPEHPPLHAQTIAMMASSRLKPANKML